MEKYSKFKSQAKRRVGEKKKQMEQMENNKQDGGLIQPY